jgi:glucosamine-6-phosphate deaminase
MSKVTIHVFDTPQLAAAGAGDAFIEGMADFDSKLAGLAAGQTMHPVYEHLIRTEIHSSGLFSQITFAQLDEVMSSNRDEASFAEEINKYLLSRLSGGYRAFLDIDGRTNRPDLEAKRHRANLLANGGLGVQLLGLGVNGHVGFNEPGCHPESECRVTALAESTLERNGYKPDTRAITLGIAEIMSAQRIVMVATGAAKSSAIAEMINEPQSLNCPASLLRPHTDIKLFLDRAAAKNL